MLHTRCSELIHFITRSSYPLTKICPIPTPSALSNHCSKYRSSIPNENLITELRCVVSVKYTLNTIKIT